MENQLQQNINICLPKFQIQVFIKLILSTSSYTAD